MTLAFRKLHPLFAAEAGPVDLREVHDRATLERIRAGMDDYGVLVFREQPFTDPEQLAFAQRLDGKLHTKTGASALMKNRLGDAPVGDISNIGPDGKILDPGDRRRMYSLANRLWHTDASFQDPPGRYSMLSARVVPPVRADTEFADMRAAWEALEPATRELIAGLTVHHSIAHSRQTLGFEFSGEEQERLKGAVHPITQANPRTGRRALYLASHATRIMEWPVPDGRLLLGELMEHATRREFVYAHEWRPGDFVIWDNLATMHRATRFDDARHHRELRRVTTLDVELAVSAAHP